MEKVPPVQRGLSPRAALVWIRLLSKGEKQRSDKEQDESNGTRLTANSSQIRFFICSGDTLKVLKL